MSTLFTCQSAVCVCRTPVYIVPVVSSVLATERDCSKNYEKLGSDLNAPQFCVDHRSTFQDSVNGDLRWLDTVFQGQYLPSLSIIYLAINKVLEKLPPQLYQIKMKICYDQGCNDIGVVIATK